MGLEGNTITANSLKLYITNAGTTASRVEVTINTPTTNLFEEKKTIITGSTEVITLPASLLTTASAINEHGIYIKANGEVSVMAAVNDKTGGCGGFAVVPLDGLGYEYFVALPAPESSTDPARSYIGIMSAEADTDVFVQLTPRKSLTVTLAGSTYNSKDIQTGHIYKPLEAFQTMTLQSGAGDDVNGVYIYSPKRLAVFTASTLNLGGEEATDKKDYILEQLHPIHAYGLFYVAVPPPSNSKYGIQIGASQDLTSIVIYTVDPSNKNTISVQISLSKAEVYPSDGKPATMDGTYPVYVAANKGIQLILYTYSQATVGLGSPSSVLVPSLDQYSNVYTFELPLNDAEVTLQGYLFLVIIKGKENGLHVDSTRVSLAWKDVPGTNPTLRAGHYAITKGSKPFVVQHMDGATKFGAYVHARNIGTPPRSCSISYQAGGCLNSITQVRC